MILPPECLSGRLRGLFLEFVPVFLLPESRHPWGHRLWSPLNRLHTLIRTLPAARLSTPHARPCSFCPEATGACVCCVNSLGLPIF